MHDRRYQKWWLLDGCLFDEKLILKQQNGEMDSQILTYTQILFQMMFLTLP